ncbi:hypothetical protein [Actinacidiphila acidipaludis]|uniref:Uncharacterized protein n=1 Tax=Actinacidiphila acidipaludis TaxID=2873382 RepID=A0ABS7Q6G7_9ACTN|nr:hypothetical protein [Streptomyces acidipaludis]MBY8878741.1 hypothetical protein [Streptomyces acidipaludis]
MDSPGALRVTTPAERHELIGRARETGESRPVLVLDDLAGNALPGRTAESFPARRTAATDGDRIAARGPGAGRGGYGEPDVWIRHRSA